MPDSYDRFQAGSRAGTIPKLMRQQDLPDSALLEKAAGNASRLNRDLGKYRPAAPGVGSAPESLGPALDALRDLSELLKKESQST